MSRDPAFAALDEYLDDLARRTPALTQVLAAFAPLLRAQAVVRAALPPLQDPDPDAPLESAQDLLHGQGLDLDQYLRQAAQVILPAVASGLPALAEPAAALERALPAGACLEAWLRGDEAEIARLAGQAGVAPEALGFLLLALAKPLLEHAAQGLAPLRDGREMRQGTCPICGAPPELAYLEGEGGQRWLRCSLCAYHWRFPRLVCPVCGNDDQQKLEFFYAEGRERERVEACQSCGRYLLTLDLRGLDQQPVWAAAALGLVHLDLLAQQKGLTPAAWCAWNQVL